MHLIKLQYACHTHILSPEVKLTVKLLSLIKLHLCLVLNKSNGFCLMLFLLLWLVYSTCHVHLEWKAMACGSILRFVFRFSATNQLTPKKEEDTAGIYILCNYRL